MRYFVLGFGICAAAAMAFAQPSVPKGGVLNSASYALQGLPNSGIAQGSIFVVFGTGLGPTTLQEINSFPLQTTFGGTSIQVVSGSTTVNALMIYTSATQLAAIMPSNTPAGSATLTVTYNNQTSSPVDIQVVAGAFGIYAVNQAGNGPGIITDASYKVPALNTSLKPGQTVIIWGTGIGPVTGDEAAGPLPADMSMLDVKVYVGSALASITYRGRSGCCAGLDQIGFVIPSGITGCRVPITVTTGSTVSNFVTIPVSSNGEACSDPALAPLGSIDYTKLQQQGTVSIGSISLQRSANTSTEPPPIGTGQPQTTTTDGASASFEKITYSAFNDLQNPFGIQYTSYGSCTVFAFSGNSTSVTDPFTATATWLDAGSALTVTGPNGPKQVARQTSGTTTSYYAQLGGGTSPATALYLDPGSYTVTAPGGNGVGGFTANITVPQPLTWTNASSISTITRANGQSVTWSGGDPNGIVTIDGFSVLAGTNPDGSDTVGAFFFCTAKASDGKFTIPPNVLLSLPPSTVTTIGGFSFSLSSLSLATGTLGSFTATGLDIGVIDVGSSASESVTYQ